MIIDTLIAVPTDIHKRAIWAVNTLMNAAGVSWRAISDPGGEPFAILLRYGGKGDISALRARVMIVIPCDPDFYRVDRDPRLLEVVRKTMVRDGSGLVSIEKDRDTAICCFRADILANIFFHLSRVEEVIRSERDSDGKFYAEQSLSGQAGLLQLPAVDELADLFVHTLIGACRMAGIPLLRKARWPNGERMALFLSHDVDRLRKWTPGRIIREARRGFKRVVEVGKAVISGDDPYWRGFREIIAVEEYAGIRSTFYVGGRSVRRTIKERRDLSYRLRKEQELVAFLSQVIVEGWEVGLHGSLTSFLSAEQLHNERMELERHIGVTVAGVRQHYLRLAFPETWRCQEAAGFLYDTTLGYADAEGFRAGTSLPFIPYDIQREQPFTIIEIPLVVMDVTLDGYRHYDARTAEEQVFSLLSTVEKHCGVFSCLIHQNAFDTEERPFIGEIYRKVLLHTSSERIYRATGEEIAQWWRQQTGMTIQDIRQEDRVWRWVWQSSADIDCITLEVDGVKTFRSIDIHGCNGEVCRRDDGSATIRLKDVSGRRSVEIVMVV